MYIRVLHINLLRQSKCQVFYLIETGGKTNLGGIYNVTSIHEDERLYLFGFTIPMLWIDIL